MTIDSHLAVLTLPHQRLNSWFNNHTGARSSKAREQSRLIRNTIRAMLVGQTKRKLKQRLQSHQAYSAIYWKSKLKLRIRAEWEARHTGDRTNPANSGEYLRFMN